MTSIKKYWWAIALFLFGWWWWKRTTLPGTTTVNGSSLTMAGYARGDTSDAALAALSSETVDYLNAVNYTTPRYGDSGTPLYEAYLAWLGQGRTADVEMARQQIGARLATNVHV
jgi:hypothetical protein